MLTLRGAFRESVDLAPGRKDHGLAPSGSEALSRVARGALVGLRFVALLLIKVSGIPMLERKGRRLWGNDPAYVRSASRERFTPGYRDFLLGFRLARSSIK